MIARRHYLSRVKKALGRNPVVALLGKGVYFGQKG